MKNKQIRQFSLPRPRASMPVMHAGTSLLLAVLLVLMLSVLALLTFSAARSDYAFSRKMAEKQTQYYNACSQSEEILAQVSRAIREAGGREPDLTGLGAALRDNVISWEVPINEDQLLSAAVSAETGAVLHWQAVPANDWAGEEHPSNLQP